MEENSLDINKLLSDLSRGLMYALPLAVIGAGLTYFLSQGMEPVYEATTTVITSQANTSGLSNNSTFTMMPISSDGYKAVLLSDAVISDTLESFGIDEIDQRLINETRDNISLGITEDTRFRLSTLLNISYKSSSPVVAANVVNALTGSLIAWDALRLQQNAEQAIRTLEQQLRALDDDIEALRLMGDLSSQQELESRLILRAQQQQELLYARALQNSAPGLLSVIQPAVPPLEPIAPQPFRYAMLAFLGVTILGLALWLLFNALDTRIRSAEDIRAAGQIPVIAEITRKDAAPEQSAYKRNTVDLLRANIFQESSGSSSKAILVTSPNVVPTKARLAAELAESFGLSGYHTLLVDLDLVNPVTVTPYDFTRETSFGLTKVLVNPPGYQAVEARISDSKRISVISMSDSDEAVSGYLGRSFREALEYWKDHFDVIVISGPPVLGNADTLTIAPMCNDTVLAVDLKSVDRRSLRKAAEWLKGVGVKTLGAIALQPGAMQAHKWIDVEADDKKIATRQPATILKSS